MMNLLIGIFLSYLVGAFPTAYLFGRARGLDIRQHGSGNVGATNAFRILGKKTGICVLLIDILKGFLGAAAIPKLLGMEHIGSYVILGLAAVAGHNWTIFLKFKGGKGIATSFGVLMGLAVAFAFLQPILWLTLFVWLVVFFTFRYVSLASIAAATFLPVFMVLFNLSIEVVLLGIILCIFVVTRHRSNLHRIFSGQEPRVPLFGKNNFFLFLISFISLS